MVVSTVNKNVKSDDDDNYDETDNSSEEESEYEFSEEEADNSEDEDIDSVDTDSEEEQLVPVVPLPPRNIVAPVRLIDEQQRFTQGIYHGRVDQWDRNFNGHKPE